MSVRKNVRLTAAAAIVAYAVVRLFIVKATLEKYGVNPWVFFVIDAITGVIYILGIEQLVLSFTKKTDVKLGRIITWSFITAAAFGAPYVYMYTAGQAMPPIVGLGLSVIVVLLLANAIVLFRRRLRARK